MTPKLTRTGYTLPSFEHPGFAAAEAGLHRKVKAMQAPLMHHFSVVKKSPTAQADTVMATVSYLRREARRLGLCDKYAPICRSSPPDPNPSKESPA